MKSDHITREQSLLKLSIVVTLVSSITGIGFGLWISSKAIVFDGIYEVVDAAMTVTALFATRLIARGDDDRFQYGYWHLEPILALVNGMVLSMACLYALVDGVNGLIVGGKPVQFGAGLLFSAVSAVLSLGMYLYIRKRGAGLESQLLALDARAWLIGAFLSLGLCISFAIGGVLADTQAEALTPYVDSAILIGIALCLVPFPVRTVWKAAREILQIAPTELDFRVRLLAKNVAAKYGFVDYDSHVMSVGRARFIEIGFVAPSGAMTMSFAELDAVRADIAHALGGLKQGHWLTVDFTADKRWI